MGLDKTWSYSSPPSDRVIIYDVFLSPNIELI